VWCERRLLARIHRYTLDRLRAEIQPVTPAEFMRFLFRWHHVEPGHQMRGVDGLGSVMDALDGCELPAVAWEADILPARVDEYEPGLLDRLCMAGRVAWGRFSGPALGGSGLRTSGPLKSSPIAMFKRDSNAAWAALVGERNLAELSEEAAQVREALEKRGASFFDDLVRETGLLATRVERALGELAALGYVTSDSFAGLRALLTPSDRRPALAGRARSHRATGLYGVDTAGRWVLLDVPGTKSVQDDGAASAAKDSTKGSSPGSGPAEAGAAASLKTSGTPRFASVGASWERPEVERFARALLRRYGVVFRRVLDREPLAPPWRNLVMVLRRLEARGEVRGGRFITGFTGEQFALAEAVTVMRAVRKEGPTEQLIVISAADPLNLTGVVTPGERIPAFASTRIGYRAGVPIFVREKGEVRSLVSGDAPPSHEITMAMSKRKIPPALRAYVGRR
jgi:ATP-dependent helicase Lhr and Lhr-like helicase